MDLRIIVPSCIYVITIIDGITQSGCFVYPTFALFLFNDKSRVIYLYTSPAVIIMALLDDVDTWYCCSYYRPDTRKVIRWGADVEQNLFKISMSEESNLTCFRWSLPPALGCSFKQPCIVHYLSELNIYTLDTHLSQ